MSWFWLNVPAAAVIFSAMSGIPLYMVLRHPNWGPERADSDERPVVKTAVVAQPAAVTQLAGDVLPAASIIARFARPDR